MNDLARAQAHYDSMLPEESDYPECRLTDDIFVSFNGDDFLFMFTDGEIESIMIDDEGTEVARSQFDHPKKHEIFNEAYQLAEERWTEIVKRGAK